MQKQSWWLAIIATLLTPWVGPHIDHYLPIGWVLFRAGAEKPDHAFWMIAILALSLVFLVWLALFSGLAALLKRRQNKPCGANKHDIQ